MNSSYCISLVRCCRSTYRIFFSRNDDCCLVLWVSIADDIKITMELSASVTNIQVTIFMKNKIVVLFVNGWCSHDKCIKFAILTLLSQSCFCIIRPRMNAHEIYLMMTLVLIAPYKVIVNSIKSSQSSSIWFFRNEKEEEKTKIIHVVPLQKLNWLKSTKKKIYMRSSKAKRIRLFWREKKMYSSSSVETRHDFSRLDKHGQVKVVISVFSWDGS